MAKKKISFDIEIDEFEKLKLLVQRHNLGQGTFLRTALNDYMTKYDEDIIKLYVLENDTLIYKTINKSDYLIEVDNSCLTKEIVNDFDFVQSGFLIKEDKKMRFYSKRKIEK